ncbi:MAG TPA: hypothetical protein VJJ47_03610 [Candidatus Paceibacterota bacterium]
MSSSINFVVNAFYLALSIGVLGEALGGHGRSVPQRCFASAIFVTGLYALVLVAGLAVSLGIPQPLSLLAGFAAAVALQAGGRLSWKATVRVPATAIETLERRRCQRVWARTDGGLLFQGSWPYGEQEQVEVGDRFAVQLTVSVLTGWPLGAQLVARIPQ